MSCTESSNKLSPRSHAIDKRKHVSMQRWRILKEALLGRRSSETCQHSVSVRRFKSFGLLTTQKLSDVESDSFGEWYEYTVKDIPDFKMTIRQLPGVITPESLRGFNNTGNVCVWPAEEVMAYYCLQHSDWFSGKTVCELGGGMTCLAGVALSVATDVSYVELCDGNEESVSNLKEIIKKNMENDSVDKTKLSASVIRWGLDPLPENMVEKFDFVLCADCLFFDDGREDLARTIESLLKPEGEALIFAPRRGDTFDKFTKLASERFQTQVEENYNSRLWDLHCQLLQKSLELYDPNIHFPIYLKLRKPQGLERRVHSEDIPNITSCYTKERFDISCRLCSGDLSSSQSNCSLQNPYCDLNHFVCKDKQTETAEILKCGKWLHLCNAISNQQDSAMVLETGTVRRSDLIRLDETFE